MLDPPSSMIALILFCAISCCAFCTRAARSSAVIGLTSPVIGFSAASAGCILPLAAGCVCADAVSAVLLHAEIPMPTLATEPVCMNARRFMISVSPFLLRASSACVLDERPVLQLGIGLLQLRASVHHDRSIPRDRLFERTARD